MDRPTTNRVRDFIKDGPLCSRDQNRQIPIGDNRPYPPESPRIISLFAPYGEPNLRNCEVNRSHRCPRSALTAQRIYLDCVTDLLHRS